MTQIQLGLVVGATAVISAFGGVLAIMRFAAKHALDIPNERSSHTRPTPRGGGAAIVVVTLVGAGLWSLACASPQQIALQLLLPALLIALVGWLDDVRSLSARVRLGAQSLAAIWVLSQVGPFERFAVPWLGEISLGAFGWIVTFIWIVGLTNAYNFMDGIDGIAGSQGVVAGCAWGAAGLLLDQPELQVLGLLCACSSAGFLLHNWPPARIFMGDVGSTFLGFTFAIMPLLAGAEHRARMGLFGLLTVLPFVADTSTTMAKRALRGERIWTAHREHLYQRLVQRGRSHRDVTLLYAGAAAGLSALALYWLATD